MKLITVGLVFAISLSGYSGVYAQKKQKLNLTGATVFIRGAELVSNAKVNLQKGENEIVFTNVAGSVNKQSITVNATNGVVVESVTFQDDYVDTQNVSARVQAIEDSIEVLKQRKSLDSNKIAGLNEQIAVLQSNRKIGGANAVGSTPELLKMLEIAGAKTEAYLNQRNAVERGMRKVEVRLRGLAAQLEEEQQEDYQAGGKLIVKFYAKEATASNIAVTYVSPGAGWRPTYDVRADDVKSPVQFYYKAEIYQITGIAWNDIHLALSTGNPQEGMQAPTLNPFFLAFYTPDTKRRRGEEVVNDRNTYAWGNVPRSKEGGNLYVIDGVQIQGNTGIDMAQGATETLQVIAVDNSGINTTFDIELPYTIPSDGQEHLVAVKKYDVPATYEYYTAPKADKDAFLLAKITNWQDLNLLPGQTNIFYEGTYVGEGYIDTRNIKDTMSISLGRDKKIVVKRERDKMQRSMKMIGSNVRESFAYTITVRNTRKDQITMILQDQLPVSNDKDIVVEDIENAGATYEEQTGMMKWPLVLRGNETKTLKFSFTVKYPKNKQINLR